MTKFTRLATIAAAAVISMQLTGCMTAKMSAPTPTMETATKLRAANLAPVAVGAFKIDPSKSGIDSSISLRGGNSVQAEGGSFAQYLGETLKVELASAGLLEPASQTVITGTLTQSEANAAVGTANAKLAARFVVTRGATVAFDRELSADASWESSFVGATAIPLAAQKYEGLYRTLVGNLVNDADFRAAIAKK